MEKHFLRNIMTQKTAAIILPAVFVLFSSHLAFSANTYENLSLNYEYSSTEYDNSATADKESHLAFVNYVLSDDTWTTQIKLSYLPEQNIQESAAETVQQESLSAEIEMLYKYKLTPNTYFGPKLNYTYAESKKITTTTAPSTITEIHNNADRLSGVVSIGYCLTDKSDITVSYTYRDDFLTADKNNTRPISLDLLYTLESNDSLHLSIDTLTENQDPAVDRNYTVTIGFGATF